MVEGFYADIKRGEKVGILAGPFPNEPAARAWLPQARNMAMDIDPRAAFDLFGTVRLERPDGAVLPKGVLNARLEVPEAELA